MSLWRQIARGVRVLANRRAADQDVADEVQHYLDQATAELEAGGLAPDEARRVARLQLGGVTSVREQVRAYGWENLVSTLLADVRYAARRLCRSPGFTAVAVLTLALGIGAGTAIVSALDPILFEPLPYPHAGQIAMILENGRGGVGTFAMYSQLAARNRSLDAVAVMKRWQPAMTGSGEPERLEGQRVSADYFQVLGVPPAAGRDFEPADDRFQGPNVVILSDALWRRRFAGDVAIVGRAIRLDDTLFTVIGVMPRGFENVLAPDATLWAPLQYDASLPPQGREWGHHLTTIGRLRSGVAWIEATREIDAHGRAVLAERHPDTYDPNTRFAVASLRGELTRGVKPALLAILGAVMLVLAIACVNVTNLLLARGAQRRGEFALRAALGAGRGRLVRQLLTESLLLAAAGGAAGMAVAAIGVRALVALSPAGLPRLGAIRVDATMFAFGLGITTLIGLAFGVMPALQAARRDLHHGLQHASHRTAGGRRRTRNALVIAEVALALVLLVSSGLLLRSLNRLFALPIGFDAGGLLTMQVRIAGHRFDDRAASHRFFVDALDAVRRVPGVSAAGLTAQLPFSGDRDEYGAHFEATPDFPAYTYAVFRYAVSPGYLETMGIPLLGGRLLDERDTADAPLAVVISESLARARFHDRDAIGERLQIGPAGPFTIVGVVGNVKQLSLALSDTDAVYHTAAQSWFAERAMSLVVRARGDAAALAPLVRQAVWSVDKDQPVVRVGTMEAWLAASEAERRFALVVFEVFALAALVLAAIGIYGVLSGSVTERTREIGVRWALGASRADILVLVLRQGMTLTALGVAIGIGGAVVASRALVTLLFGVSRLDPLTYLGVVAILLAASAVACWLPAWRAARVDPSITLRSE